MSRGRLIWCGHTNGGSIKGNLTSCGLVRVCHICGACHSTKYKLT